MPASGAMLNRLLIQKITDVIFTLTDYMNSYVTKNNCQKTYPAHSTITKRDLNFRGRYF